MSSKFKVLSKERAINMGYSEDKRKRRREHRQNARTLIKGGTLFNHHAPRGSTPNAVAQWHLFQARWCGR